MSRKKQDGPSRWVKNLTPRTNKQADYIEALCQFPIVIAEGAAGSGKAQPWYSKVKVPNGWKNISDIQTGDLVSTPDNKLVKVLNTYPQGLKPVYRMTLNDGRTVDACEDHLWKIIYGTKERLVSFKDFIKDYESSTRNRFYLPLCNPIEEEEKEFYIHPYVLGVLLGDGCLVTSGTPTISSADIELIDKVSELVKSLGYCLHKIPSGKYEYTLKRIKKTNSANDYVSKLKELSLWKKRSWEKHIPNQYLYGSIEQRLQLIQGLMDTDGTISLNNGLSFCTTSITLAQQMQYLIHSLGGFCSIKSRIPTYTYNGIKQKGRIAYNLHISRLNINLKKQLCSLQRKKDRIKKGQYDDSNKIRIDNIEYIGMQDCYCILIDHEEHLYLTDNFIVTHNTLLAVYRATREIDDNSLDRIILVRPIVATEDLGYLPGGIEDKVDPYMRPLFDALYSRWGPAVVAKKMDLNEIEIAPLAYMRGRTLNNCFVILDEAQNTTVDQMRMFLTRMGDNVKVAITGDITQYDLGKYNGLTWALAKLKDCPSVACIKFDIKDVVRSDLAKQILEYIDD